MALTQTLGKRPSPAASDIHVAFGVDCKYVPAVGACIHSIITNNENMRIQFHVITTSLPQTDVEQLAAFSERNAITVQVHILGPEALSKFPERMSPRFSSAIYNRVLICEILDGITSRVLYLDADIICLGSMADITRIRMDGKIVAAVADVVRSQDLNKGNIGLVTDEPYFNSGVLYIDIEKWNRGQVTQNVIKTLIDSGGKFPYPDQDSLNKVLAGKVAFIDKRWNLFFDHFKPDSDTIFLHYLNDKPWQAWSKNFGDTPFLSNIAGTPWASWEDHTPLSRSQRIRHARKLLRRGKVVKGLHWYALALCTQKTKGTRVADKKLML
jgi:lipopolysaccharide biosynthesis glycosyltransferase